jgi:hypothetical protein
MPTGYMMSRGHQTLDFGVCTSLPCRRYVLNPPFPFCLEHVWSDLFADLGGLALESCKDALVVVVLHTVSDTSVSSVTRTFNKTF